MKRLAFLLWWWMPAVLFAQGSGLPNAPYVYVEGNAKVTREPDVVTLSFKLGSRDPDLTTASKQMQAQAVKVMALLDREKIAEKDVQAEGFHSEPEYESRELEEAPPSEGKIRKIVAYHVTRPFSVVVREVSSFPKLVDQLLALGIEEFVDISTGLSNEQELAKQVRNQALANARAEAEEILKPEKQRILSVYAISPVPFPEISSRIFHTEDSEKAVYPVNFGPRSKLDPTQYRLAPIDVSQKVHVIYLIGQDPAATQ